MMLAADIPSFPFALDRRDVAIVKQLLRGEDARTGG